MLAPRTPHNSCDIFPALFDINCDREAVAEILIDWLIDHLNPLANDEAVTLGWMMDGAADVDEDLPLVMALAMGDKLGWDADRSRQISQDYVAQWLAYYGRDFVESRIESMRHWADPSDSKLLIEILDMHFGPVAA